MQIARLPIQGPGTESSEKQRWNIAAIIVALSPVADKEQAEKLQKMLIAVRC